jgi:hypothetical protein
MEGKRISRRKFPTTTTPSLRDGLASRSDGGEGASPSTYLRNPGNRLKRDPVLANERQTLEVISRKESRDESWIFWTNWRRGELNPCPRRYPRKHLHVYPVKSFKEPNVASAHCRLPSVREIDSQTDAVAPPVCQPAVHVCRHSRRPTPNVAVN